MAVGVDFTGHRELGCLVLRWKRTNFGENFIDFFSFLSLQTLSHVGQGHGKSLQGGEGVLEVEGVGVAVDSAKLHDLGVWESKGENAISDARDFSYQQLQIILATAMD